MRSATGHDEQHKPVGGASVRLEAASTLYFSVGRRLCSDLVRENQGFQPYGLLSAFSHRSDFDARSTPAVRSKLARADRAFAAGIVGELYPIM